LSVTVPVDICPETTVAGLNENAEITGGFTVSATFAVGFVLTCGAAVMVTGEAALTGFVVTVKVPLLAPAAMLKAGTETAVVLLGFKLRVTGSAALGGAGPVSTSVATEAGAVPPVMEFRESVNVLMPGGLTVIDVVLFTLFMPIVAVTITVLTVVTPTVVAVNVPVFDPLGIVMFGTVTDGSEVLMVTVAPPVGAAWLSVTVPVTDVPPVTLVG